MFNREWQRVDGKVVATEVAVETAAGYEDRLRYAVDIQRPDGSAQRVTLEEPKFIRGGFAQPGVGDVVGVLVDPKSQKAKFDTADPRINLGAQQAAGRASFDAATAAAAGTPPPVAPDLASLAEQAEAAIAATAASPGENDDTAARLAKLDDLRTRGLITEAEYASQRQKIIDAV